MYKRQFLHRQPFKEALAGRTGGATVRQLAARLTARGEREKQVLALARHVLGRTGWDKAYCEQHAPAAQYYPLGEIPVSYTHLDSSSPAVQ